MASSKRVTLLIYHPAREQALQIRDVVAARFPQLCIGVAATAEQARPLVAGADIIAGWGFPPELLAGARRLRWFHKLGAGVDDLVLSDRLPAEVVLTRTNGRVFARRMAEYVMAYILAFCQDIRRVVRQQQARRWQPFLPKTAAGRTVGVAGLGDIGTEVAQLATAMGMRVVGWRRSPAAVGGVERVYAGRKELVPFLAESEFVVIVLPLTRETRGLLGRQELSAMRQGAYLINVGRGPIVDEAALLEALQSGRLAGAALDVFAREPLPEGHPLWELDNVYITPHISGPGLPEELGEELCANLARYMRGEPLAKQVPKNRGY
ncbi:MAG: D-2-hydroxyacid dehydrogenase [Firmicutes bacterium]|nr:D-2-hydroxyacid dehydrogenase [Bacillota bacterium]